MMSAGLKLLKERSIPSHTKAGVLVANVPDQDRGLSLANDLLLRIVDSKTFLLLSGGRTPWVLYETIAKEKKLRPGAVGMVDERYGPKRHETSNEKKMEETGLVTYLESQDIPFYPILADKETRGETATAYDMTLREAGNMYQKSVGILGIGMDGHTAGLPVRNEKRKAQYAKLYDHDSLVTEYNDTSGVYGERVTMTFLGLSLLDVLIVLVFGEDKRGALDMVFSDGPEKEIPGRFYKRPAIAKKTLVITDQKF